MKASPLETKTTRLERLLRPFIFPKNHPSSSETYLKIPWRISLILSKKVEHRKFTHFKTLSCPGVRWRWEQPAMHEKRSFLDTIVFHI